MGIAALPQRWVSVRRRLVPGRVKLLSWLLATWTSFTALHATVQKYFVSHYALCRELINPFQYPSVCFLPVWGVPWFLDRGSGLQDAGLSCAHRRLRNKEPRGMLE